MASFTSPGAILRDPAGAARAGGRAASSLGGGLREVALGTPGSVDTQTLATLTPEQQELLKQLIAEGRQEAPDISTVSTPTTTEAAPIAAAQVTEPSTITGGSAAGPTDLSSSESAQLFRDVAGGTLSEEDKQSFIESNIVQPLTKQAQEGLKSVGRTFGAGGFFSSDRQRQDEGIQTAFADALTREIAKLELDLRGQDIQSQLSAGSGLAGLETAELGAETTTNVANLEALIEVQKTNLEAELKTAIANGNFTQAANIQNSINEINTGQFNVSSLLSAEQATVQRDLGIEGLSLQQQQQLQQLLGVQGIENVVTAIQPVPGQLGGLAAGIAGAIALSDRRFKYNIKKIISLPIGIDLVSWHWKHNDRKSIGVIAQDLQKVMPEAVVSINGILHVLYNVMWGNLVWQQ